MRIFSFIAFILIFFSRVNGQQYFSFTYSLPVITTTMIGDDTIGGNVEYDISGTTIRQIINSANRGQLALYDNGGKVISVRRILDLFQVLDTVEQVDPITLEQHYVVVSSGYNIGDLSEDVVGFCMKEEWSISESGAIEKSVKAYAPLYGIKEHKLKPIYWIRPSSDKGTKQYMRVTYKTDLNRFDNPKDSSAFRDQIIEAVSSGKAKVYDIESDKLLTTDEIKRRFEETISHDTITEINPIELTESTHVDIFKEKVFIDQIRFVEEWEMDERGNFAKRVKEYYPLTGVHDHHTGKFLGWLPILKVVN